MPTSAFRYVILTLIVTVCLALGTAYAALTPKWEVPDEPAHYNYIAHLAENHSFPVLQMGDYPHEYLEEIKAAKFPDHMSIAPLRYEFHQPPLYYILAALVYKTTGFLSLDQQVVVLRLFSVALGCLLLLATYRLIKEVFPTDEVLALATTAFVATVPMHIAMTAAINNDMLAELILSLLLLLAIKRLKDNIAPRRYAVCGGILLGLGLLTKTTVYPAILLLAVAEVERIALRPDLLGDLGVKIWGKPFHLRIPAIPLVSLLSLFSLSSLLSFWWFLRNVLVYGDFDLFGWGRHDTIVVGQPRTAEWVARFGTARVAREFVFTTFKSFWAQFGWMGILIDERIYLGLALLCAVAGLGFALLTIKVFRQRDLLTPFQRSALALLALSFLFSLLSYLWYNLKFVQHQGRYLFPAIVPIGLFFVIGLRELMAREHERLLLSLLFLGLMGLDALCLFGFIVPYFR